MKKITYLLLLISCMAYAQKNAPVAGHAARLVDLLKKDYTTVDIATRTELMNKDMQEVIATLMVYTDGDKTFLEKPYTSVESSLKSYQDALINYNQLTKLSQNFTIGGEKANAIFETLKESNKTLNEKKIIYDDEVYRYNIESLERLKGYFSLNGNGYLSHISALFTLKYTEVKNLSFDTYAQTNYTTSIQKALPFFGGDLAFSQAIDGLSRFLAQRIKDELTTYAIEKVQYYLNNPQPESYLNELMVLLPTTTAYLKSFDASRTLNFVNDLKQYIEDDLNNLLANAAHLKDTPRFKKYIQDNPDLDFAFEALELLPQISKLENPIDYFDMLENSRNIQRWANLNDEALVYAGLTVELIERYADYRTTSNIPEKLKLLEEAAKNSKIYTELKYYNDNIKPLLDDFITKDLIGYLNADKTINNLNEAFSLNKLHKLKKIKAYSLKAEHVLNDVFTTKLNTAITEFEDNKKSINATKTALFYAITALKNQKVEKINNTVLKDILHEIIKNYDAAKQDILFKKIEALDSNHDTTTDTAITQLIADIKNNYKAIRDITFTKLDEFKNESNHLKTDYSSILNSLNSSDINAYKKLLEDEVNILKKESKNIKYKKAKEAAEKVITSFTSNQTIDSLTTLIKEFKKVSVMPTSQKLQYNVANTIKLASMLAHSLMIVEDGKPKFASTAFMSGYSSEVNFYLLYIGFLHQQNKKYYNVAYILGDDVKELDLSRVMVSFSPEIVNQKAKEFRVVSENLIKIASNAEKLHNSLVDIKKANAAGEKITAEQVHSLTADVIDFSEDVLTSVDTIISTPSLKLFDTADIKTILAKTKPYITTARTVNDIFMDLHTKKYTTALIKAIEIPTAFGKEGEQYQLYDKISKVTNTLSASQRAYNLKKLLSYTRTYDDERGKTQKDVATWIKISFESDSDYIQYKTDYADVYTTIINENEGFYDKIKEFKKKIATDTLFYRTYLDLDTKRIAKRTIEFIKKKAPGTSVPSNLEINIKDILDRSIAFYLTGDTNNKKELEEQKRLLLQNLRYYLPEMFPDIFQFKDENVVKLIHFVNDLANAENAEDVEKALNTFALPPGSSSLKEKVNSYFSVNAYPGLYGGFTTSSLNKGDTWTTGFTAPVGLYAQLMGNRSFGTLGLFIPVIDIAAPVRLRLGNNTDQLPDLEFKDIFSPGLYLSYGFNKSPFAINAGCQYGPSLKSVDSVTTTDEQGNANQGLENRIEKKIVYWSLSLTIDIPLFTLHAKSRD